MPEEDAAKEGEPSLGQGRASSKVILFGEHAVVYGVSAIAAGIDRGATAVARSHQVDEIWLGDELLARGTPFYTALTQVRQHLSVGPARVDLTLEIPAGAGLGASASLGVATIRALAQLHNRHLNDQILRETGHLWECVFHGNPSGVDVAAALQSCPIRFSRGLDPEPLLLNQSLRLVIALAGPPASTKEMVASVQRFKERNPEQFQKTLEAIAALVDNATLLLRSGDLQAVGKLMDLNQMLLASWMVSTEEIEIACRLARDAGALGAKLTGSGGGGAVIALTGKVGDEESEERAQSVQRAWQNAGIRHFSTEITGTHRGCAHT